MKKMKLGSRLGGTRLHFPALGRLRQEDAVETSLDNTVRPDLKQEK
jgi:hypothetical protein